MQIFLVHLKINSILGWQYNYGLGYIASVLKANGHKVKYIALRTTDDIRYLVREIETKKPAIIGFSTATSDFSYLKSITEIVKVASDSFIVCGGVHPTLNPDCIKEIPEIDAIVRGEGEFPLLELANLFEKGHDFLAIKNIWFKTKEGIVRNEMRPFIENLDTLPFPDKDSLDYQKVIDESGGINRFIFSRGCVFDCSYCSNKALSNLAKGKYFRQRSPKNAIEEIKLDEAKYRFNYIIFDDDTMSLSKKWFYEFFTLYQNNFKYKFSCNIRPGTIDENMIRFLKECGADNVGIGLEHGNERFRRTVLKRDISNRQTSNTIALCEKYQISHYEFVMLGFPFETKELFFDTVRFCRKAGVKNAALYIFHPYPATELGMVCKKHGWIPNEEYYKERVQAVLSYPKFNKYEIQSCRDAFFFLLQVKFVLLIPYIPLKFTLRLNQIINNLLSRRKNKSIA